MMNDRPRVYYWVLSPRVHYRVLFGLENILVITHDTMEFELDDEQDDNDWWDAVASQIINLNIAFASVLEEESDGNNNEQENEEQEDDLDQGRRVRRRCCRTEFHTDEAAERINRDFLADASVFNGSAFQDYFRISRTRFQRILEDVCNAGIKFYSGGRSANLNPVSSIEARLLLPIKTLAFGVAAHAFADYFQISKPFAHACCAQFDIAINQIYSSEYMRPPTAVDLKQVTKLHKIIHKVNGMFASLDCCHAVWKNCPKAWQGSYKGKEGVPTIVLEACCDYNLWFWHAAHGFPGTMNDLNILAQSPLVTSIVDGSFAEVEKESGAVPFEISGALFNQTFLLVDGIYPCYSRFVRTVPEAITQQEKKFKTWQEAARKDIERAFGVIQLQWQFMAHPIRMYHVEDIGKRVGSCIILHNMNVSDRVMNGDVRATYDPCFQVLPQQDVVAGNNAGSGGETGIQQQEGAVVDQAALAEAVNYWALLHDNEEHTRLQDALQRMFG